MRKILLAFCLVVGGCTAAQTTTATQDIQQAFTVLASACADAQIALATAQGTVKGGALNTVNSIGSYIQQGCGRCRQCCFQNIQWIFSNSFY